MLKIAVLYGTTEGQTAKIAQHVAARAREHGMTVDTLHLADLPEDFTLGAYDGVVIGASIHEGHHRRYVMRWVKEHRDALERMPNAWFSVCLAINSPNASERDEASKYPSLMQDKTGFHAGASTVFAGALKFTQYSWLKRVVMKQISKHEGGSVDTSQDHEYTDWNAVDVFADAFFNRLPGHA